MKKFILFVTFLMSCLTWNHSAMAIGSSQQIQIKVSASSHATYTTTQTVTDNAKLVKAIKRAHRVRTSREPEMVRATLSIGGQPYLFDAYDQLFFVPKKQMVLLNPQMTALLSKYVAHVEEKHYGQLLAWEVVRQHLKRMSFAEVKDLETGAHFRVQRRAGSRHADVQPLTSVDTAIMKRIYQGKWSWRRRAILVTVNGKTIAASMHGMPHGAGAIAGNNFPGHFCIHFAGSSTHTRREPDPGHSLMIMKAAGRIPQQLMAATPQQLVDWLLTAYREHDVALTHLMTMGSPLPVELDQLEALTFQEVSLGESDGFTAIIPVTVNYIVKGQKEQREIWSFLLMRPSPYDRWKVAAISRK